MKKLLILTAVAALASLSGCRKTDLTDTIPASQCIDQAKIAQLNELSDAELWNAAYDGKTGVCNSFASSSVYADFSTRTHWYVAVSSKTVYSGKDLISAAIKIRELINSCKCGI